MKFVRSFLLFISLQLYILVLLTRYFLGHDNHDHYEMLSVQFLSFLASKADVNLFARKKISHQNGKENTMELINTCLYEDLR